MQHKATAIQMELGDSRKGLGLGRGRAGFKIQNLIWVAMAEEDLWDTQ